MGYSIDPISADCYEGTTCLINKFGIKDEKKLSQMETTCGQNIYGTSEK